MAVTLGPERRDRRFEAAAEPHRADPRRQPGCRVGLDRDPQSVAGPVAASKRADGMRRMKRCSGSSLAMPITES